MGEAAYGPAAPTIIADYYPVADRGRVLAFFYMAIPVGRFDHTVRVFAVSSSCALVRPA